VRVLRNIMRAVRDGDVNANTADRWLSGALSSDERERLAALGVPTESTALEARVAEQAHELVSLRSRALRIARMLETCAADLRVICEDNITPEEAARLLARIEERVKGSDE
jgi:ABC-type branched-subunit amino acid transport system ATPase component